MVVYSLLAVVPERCCSLECSLESEPGNSPAMMPALTVTIKNVLIMFSYQ